MEKINKKIPIARPYITKEDIEFVAKILKEEQISGRASIVKEFEREFAKYIGVKYGIAVANGTAALHVALKSLGIKEKDEIIVPAFSMMAPIFAISYLNAKPILIDVDKKYWNIIINDIKKKITKKTKAILVIHTYGNPVNMDELIEISEKENIPIIEDCAEAHGAIYKNKKVGSFGIISTFSFFANKIITCGEGGMILTNDEQIAENASSFRDLMFGKKNKFLHEGIGYNYRISALQAALGLSQLRRINKHIEIKRKIAKIYEKNLFDIEEINLHKEPDSGKSVYWMYSIVLNEKSRISRNKLITKLEKKGIETRPFFIPVHKQPVYKNIYFNEKYPNSEWLSKRGLNLPSGLNLTKEEILYVCENIKKIIKNER